MTPKLNPYSFVQDESGAVTVDWIMLAAATVLIGTPVVALVSGALDTNSAALGSHMASIDPGAELHGDGDSSGTTDWVSGQWEMNNPGIYNEYSEWMAGFEDQQLLDHMQNTAQYSETPMGSGHPVDTYHDEYWIARDEAITRGLVDPNA